MSKNMNKCTIWATAIRGKDLKIGDTFYTYYGGAKKWKVFEVATDNVKECGFGAASCKGEDTLYFRTTDIFFNSELQKMVNSNMSDEEFFFKLEEASKDFNKMILTSGVGWLPQEFPIPEMKPIKMNKRLFIKTLLYFINIYKNLKLIN